MRDFTRPGSRWSKTRAGNLLAGSADATVCSWGGMAPGFLRVTGIPAPARRPTIWALASTRAATRSRGARSRSAPRFEVLLLLAHLASFVQRLIGESAREHQLELQFMASRRATRREISVLTLGRRILDATPSCLHQPESLRALP